MTNWDSYRICSEIPVIKMFEEWSGRHHGLPIYTSRTPYAGVRSPAKETRAALLRSRFFWSRLRTPHDDTEMAVPKFLMKMPEPLNCSRSFPTVANGRATQAFQNGMVLHRPWRNREGHYQRAVTGRYDAELITRHEVQETPPDLLITNYSMLEFMMTRPIERTVFDKTRAWLSACPAESYWLSWTRRISIAALGRGSRPVAASIA